MHSFSRFVENNILAKSNIESVVGLISSPLGSFYLKTKTKKKNLSLIRVYNR